MPEASTRMRSKIEFLIGVESNVCHLRQNILNLSFLLCNFSPSEILIKSNATEKKIFTSYFLSCVQLHTFRRLSLGEWPQRESASLLLNSKGKEYFIRPVNQGKLLELLCSKQKGMQFCIHVALVFVFSLKPCKGPKLPAPSF